MFIDSSIIIWLLLGMAVTGAFLHMPGASFFLLAASLTVSVPSGKLSLAGLAAVTAGLTAIYCMNRTRLLPRPLFIAPVLAWCLALFFHLLPGIHGFHVLKDVRASAFSTPFNMYLYLDKPLVFFSLFIIYPDLPLPDKNHRVNYARVAYALVFLAALLPIASLTGKIKPELSLPAWWWLFAINNLLFTCVAEEALFRGCIQRHLTRYTGACGAIMLASVLFGAAHFQSGVVVMIFATLAGMGYGFVFHYTRRLVAAITTHFLFNFSHLLFYTYPMMAQK